MNDDRSAMRTRPSLLVRVRDAADAGGVVHVCGHLCATCLSVRPPPGPSRCRRGRSDPGGDGGSRPIDQGFRVPARAWAFSRLAALDRAAPFVSFLRARLARRGEEHGQPEILDQADDQAPDADWNDAFSARVLEVALERIQPDFEPATWRAFERVWLRIDPPRKPPSSCR